MRRPSGLIAVLASGLLLALPSIASAAPGRTTIVGGSAVSISTVPWQVALVKRGSSAYDSQFCGGSIRDSLHVVTAAHCLFTPVTGQPISAAQLDVVAGLTTLSSEPQSPNPNPYRFQVSQVSFNPAYDPQTFANDSALLTLASPIPLGGGGIAEAIALADASQSGLWDGTSDVGRVSGWGLVSTNGSASDPLRAVNVPIVSDATCESAYAGLGGIDDPHMLCAGDGVHDSCYGDSGGPFTILDGSTRYLAGIVSFGVSCANASYPGVYAQVAAPDIRAFLISSPPNAPSSVTAPSLAGTPRVGQTITCDPGQWSSSPTLDYQFVRTSNGQDVALTQRGPGAAYTLAGSDLGTQVLCIVNAANAGGYARARSATTGPVAPALTPVAPTTTPPPTATPPKTGDVIAPKATILSGRCRRATRCLLSVKVTDASGSAGIKGIEVQLTTTIGRACRRNPRKRCTTRTVRTLKATKVAPGRYRITLRKPRVGRYRFAIVAVDKAGNRQLKAVIRTYRVR